MDRKPVTIWERYNPKKKRYELNHIEDGHWNGSTPPARSNEQKVKWKGAYWRKKFGYLADGKVVDVELAY
jgi:hypothetical protein